VLAPAQAARGGPPASAPATPARVVVARSPALEEGASFEAGPVPLTIGRGGDNALVLDRDEFASGRHARIEAQRDGIWIVDLGSTNGTFVNGQRIDGRRRLRPGDVVKIGDTELQVEP
jgi:pSer/pThr/pTyr-binding forkhead associated (FHA) protein